MIPNTHTIVPFLLAMLVAVAGMPTNVFQICRRSVGTLEVEPWLQRSTAALTRAVTAGTAWMRLLLGLRGPAVCAAAVLLALMAADLSASHALVGVLLAIPPVAVTGMTLDQLRVERVALVRANDGLQPAAGAAFASDEARATFDGNTARIVEIDARVRELERVPAPAAAPVAGTEAAARAAGAQGERDRITGITEAVRVAKLDPGVAADLIGRNISLDAARAEIFTKLAAQDAQNPTVNSIRVGDDVRDKWIRGATNWLLIRTGVAAMVAKHEGTTVDKLDAGEFRGLSLLDLAKDSLTRAGQVVRGLDKMALAGLAMSFRSNYQTTSDFSTLLENTMHKVLRAAYGITPDTWSRFCGIGTATDFRTHNWYRTGALSELDSVNESGEFTNKAIPDGEKATYSVGTKGNIIAISRQTIINDDMGAVVQMTQRLGRAGKLTIEKMVYALLAENSGLGPTYGSAPLFDDAAHGNVSTGAALSAAAIDLDRVKMAQQMDVNSQEYTDLRPAILLVPVALGGAARIINVSQYDPDTVANKSQMKPNIVAGLFKDIVDTPRITGTRRYLFADPAIAPVIMVSFLEGQQEPVLETQDGWRVDGVEMKARLDVGANAVDYRGAITNAGA